VLFGFLAKKLSKLGFLVVLLGESPFFGTGGGAAATGTSLDGEPGTLGEVEAAGADDVALELPGRSLLISSFLGLSPTNSSIGKIGSSGSPATVAPDSAVVVSGVVGSLTTGDPCLSADVLPSSLPTGASGWPAGCVSGPLSAGLSTWLTGASSEGTGGGEIVLLSCSSLILKIIAGALAEAFAKRYPLLGLFVLASPWPGLVLREPVLDLLPEGSLAGSMVRLAVVWLGE